MRAYKVIYDNTDKEVAYFVGSEAEARQFRMALMKDLDLKRKEIEVELVEIPTTKTELLKWLNAEMKK